LKNLKDLGYPNYCVTKRGEVFSLYSNKFLKPVKGGGYLTLTLCEDGKKDTVLIHRLVALSFLENPENKPCVNHIDGNKINNSVDNLEWCTHKENTRHAMETGLRRTEVINSYRSLDNLQIVNICNMLEEGARVKDIVEMYGLNHSIVCGIKSGKFYKDISKDYNFRNVPSKNRISEDKVLKICQLLSEGFNINYIRNRVNVSHGTVSRIKKRETYTYLSKNFKW